MKHTLREEMRARRAQLTERTSSLASRQLSHYLLTTPRFMISEAIAGYHAFGSEADVTWFLRAALMNQRRLFLPRVLEGNEMEFVEVWDLDTLVPGAFGILEPVGPPTPIHEIDAFLVPGLAFDLEGGRLGMGKGFYDRALESCRPDAMLLGVGYEMQLLESVPTQPHDISLHGFASEVGIRFF